MACLHQAIATPSPTAMVKARLLTAPIIDSTTFGAIRCGHVDVEAPSEPMSTPRAMHARAAIHASAKAPMKGNLFPYPGSHFETGSTSECPSPLSTAEIVAWTLDFSILRADRARVVRSCGQSWVCEGHRFVFRRQTRTVAAQVESKKTDRAVHRAILMAARS